MSQSLAHAPNMKISASRTSPSEVELRIGYSHKHAINMFKLTYSLQWDDSRMWLGGNNFCVNKNNQPKPI